MFSEVVKITPQVDRGALNNMFRTLNQRFGDVTRKFGAGIKNVFKFGAAGGFLAAIVAKLVNPLERAEKAIDRILEKGDDAVTNAAEFETTPGKILRLEGLAAAKGLKAEDLRALLGKFQAALAKEKDIVAAPERIKALRDKATDPTEKKRLSALLLDANQEKARGGLLRQFVNETDTADAFFKFVKSLQEIAPDRRIVAQKEVFGEKLRGKASEFFAADDFAKLLKDLPSAATLDEAAKRASGLSDEKDRLAAIRGLQDLVTKAKLVNQGQVSSQDASARRELGRENDDLRNFGQLKQADDSIDILIKKLEKTITDLTVNVIPPFVKGIEALTKALPSAPKVKDAVDKGLQTAATASVEIGDRISDFSDWIDRVKDPKSHPPDPATRLTDQQLRAAGPSDAEILKRLVDVVRGAGADLPDESKKLTDEQLRAAGPSDRELLNKLITTLEGIWGEFKSSKFYRYFGGGG